MPKIHEARGVTDARQPETDDDFETEEGEFESAGNSSSESDDKPTTKKNSTEHDPQQHARTTGSRSRKGRTDS